MIASTIENPPTVSEEIREISGRLEDFGDGWRDLLYHESDMFKSAAGLPDEISGIGQFCFQSLSVQVILSKKTYFLFLIWGDHLYMAVSGTL